MDASQIKKTATKKPADFDYSSLADAVAKDAQAAAQRIKKHIIGMKKNIIEIGTDLLAMKEKLKHGDWGKWLNAEFGMTARTARRYMRAAKQLGSMSDIVSDLPAKVLHALAAPSTPPEVKEGCLADIKAGKKPTVPSLAAVSQETVESPPDWSKPEREAAFILLRKLDDDMENFLILCEKAGWVGIVEAVNTFHGAFDEHLKEAA